MANFTPLKKDKHQNIKVDNSRNLKQIAEQHILAVTVQEFSSLAATFPLFYIKEGNNFRSVAMLGFETGQNFYYYNDKMNSLSIPQATAVLPFALGYDDEKENTLTACLDMDSEFVGEDKELALFDEAGEDSPLLKSMKEALGKIYQAEIQSENIIAELIKHELLIEYELLVNYEDGNKKRIVGIHNIDDKKLAALSDEVVLDFNKRGLFIAIHSMLISLGQVNRLVQLANHHSETKIANVSIQQKAPDPARENKTAVEV